jgi:hypothetical protein
LFNLGILPIGLDSRKNMFSMTFPSAVSAQFLATAVLMIVRQVLGALLDS